jgi:hypothetical protein
VRQSKRYISKNNLPSHSRYYRVKLTAAIRFGSSSAGTESTSKSRCRNCSQIPIFSKLNPVLAFSVQPICEVSRDKSPKGAIAVNKVSLIQTLIDNVLAYVKKCVDTDEGQI